MGSQEGGSLFNGFNIYLSESISPNHPLNAEMNVQLLILATTEELAKVKYDLAIKTRHKRQLEHG